MKTAEEWMNQLSGLNNPPLLTINRMAIREIQLDAMKEGMERTRKLILSTDPNPAWRNSKSPQSDRDEELRAAILTAAEQLTEKDL